MYKIVPRFARRIRELRKAKGLTQEKLAERAVLHVTYISLIEHGKYTPSIKTVSKLARGLNMAVWEIFLGMERQRDKPSIAQLEKAGHLKKKPGRPRKNKGLRRKY